MQCYRVTGLPVALTDEVRRTLRSPGYGHPVHVEQATGPGPCRQCLRPFRPGLDRRILFTHRPAAAAAAAAGTVTVPGPVFILHEVCERYVDLAFPPGLTGFPLLLEARGSGGRILACRAGMGKDIERIVIALLGRAKVTHLHLRHPEAGCFIARVDHLR